jgi:hypothetical protein
MILYIYIIFNLLLLIYIHHRRSEQDICLIRKVCEILDTCQQNPKFHQQKD